MFIVRTKIFGCGIEIFIKFGLISFLACLLNLSYKENKEQKMKTKIGIFLVLVTFITSVPSLSLAEDRNKQKDETESSYDESTSHNPLTGSTTKQSIRKDKRKVRINNETYEAEDNVTVKKKISGDGKKTTIERTETTTEERN
jgi:hypothetical protein